MRHAIWLTIALILGAVAGQAQDTPPPPGRHGGNPSERIEQWKKVRLIEILEMKEDQSVRFFARLNEHEARRRELMKAKGDALDRLDRLVRNRASAAELEKGIPDVFVADEKIREEQKRFLLGLTDVLTTEQRAKLLLFERQFEKELREAMREAQRKRWREEPKE
jgi:hypothetical protein